MFGCLAPTIVGRLIFRVPGAHCCIANVIILDTHFYYYKSVTRCGSVTVFGLGAGASGRMFTHYRDDSSQDYVLHGDPDHDLPYEWAIVEHLHNQGVLRLVSSGKKY